MARKTVHTIMGLQHKLTRIEPKDKTRPISWNNRVFTVIGTREYALTLDIDLDKLARQLGSKAVRSQSGKSKLAGGLIEVRAQFTGPLVTEE